MRPLYLVFGSLLALMATLPLTAGSVFVSPFDGAAAVSFEQLPGAGSVAQLEMVELGCTADCTEAGFSLDAEVPGGFLAGVESTIFLYRDDLDGLSNLTIRVPRGTRLK
jgi:hypothetical protein